MTLARAAQFALVGLFLIAAGWAVSLAPGIVSPILLAVLLNYLLSPWVRRLRARRVPGVLTAAVLLLLLFGGVGAAAVALARPAGEWVGRIPESRARLRELTRSVQKQVKPVMDAASEVEEATREMEGGGRRPQAVKLEEAPIIRRLAGHLGNLLAGAVMTFFLALLLLAPGDVFQRKLLALLPSSHTRSQLQQISDEAEGLISRYLGTIVLINAGLGVATGLAMWAVGMPNPALWGTLAMAMNYVPYLGAVVTTTIVALAAIITFDEPSKFLVPPLVFLVINLLESNLVTPKLVERWLKLNAVTTFLAVIIFWALLGIPGALMAVPILVVVKVVCDHVDTLKGFGTFLGA